MKNCKIGIRITAGFGVVILILAALGVFAWSRVAAIENNATRITSNSLPGVYLVGQIQNGIRKEFGLLLQYLNSANKDEPDRIEAQIKESRAVNAGRRAEYKSSSRQSPWPADRA